MQHAATVGLPVAYLVSGSNAFGGWRAIGRRRGHRTALLWLPLCAVPEPISPSQLKLDFSLLTRATSAVTTIACSRGVKVVIANLCLRWSEGHAQGCDLTLSIRLLFGHAPCLFGQGSVGGFSGVAEINGSRRVRVSLRYHHHPPYCDNTRTLLFPLHMLYHFPHASSCGYKLGRRPPLGPCLDAPERQVNGCRGVPAHSCPAS
jgi:hypothetical protein